MVNLSSPLVSVIIPVYNSELYLEACIESSDWAKLFYTGNNNS